MVDPIQSHVHLSHFWAEYRMALSNFDLIGRVGGQRFLRSLRSMNAAGRAKGPNALYFSLSPAAYISIRSNRISRRRKPQPLAIT